MNYCARGIVGMHEPPRDISPTPRRVIFFASSYGVGLTSLLSEQACCIAAQSKGCFLFISGEKEQFPGLFDKLQKNHVNYAKISGLDEHRNFAALVRKFREYVDQFRPNVIHAHTNWQLAIAAAVKYLYRKRYSLVYTVHGYRHNHRYRSLLARYLIGIGLYFLADKIITPSSFLRKKFSFLGARSNVLFVGVDEVFYDNCALPSFDGAKRFIFSGEFREGKNQDMLIRVLRKYIDRTGDDNTELYLPGEGATLPACKALCQQLGLENKVFFPGFLSRSEMLKYYLMCQFALVPSNVETFGQCVSEPYALGRVVMSRHVGVADDIIIPGETGFFFDTEADLLEAMADVLSDKERCRSISRNAYDGREAFRWSTICRQYLNVIEGMPS
ncbi:MAG TPA: glycosyltransferase family 4 protein [Nitrospirota bacterium]|nr:glycosyltransferase family 4 protein [Nitrospirota bacterium]